MIVNNTHQKIDALKEIMPVGFVFVLDTTDRSFIYKSKASPNQEQFVLSLDKMKGFDAQTKSDTFFSYQDDDQVLKLQKIGGNTFLGVCAPKVSFTEDKLSLTDAFISK